MPNTSLMNDREPMYGTMTTTLIHGAASNKGSMMSSKSDTASLWLILSRLQMEHVLGISAVAGASVVCVYKVTMYAMGSKQKQEDSALSRPSASHSLLGIFRRFLRRLLLDDPTSVSSTTDQDVPVPASNENDVMSPGDDRVISHQGSCHCESIQFQFLAPRLLAAREGPGKIQYRHAQINAANFRIYAGHECLKTYYVYRNNARKGAHAFCERCGVHILYAPSKRTPLLNINVNCLEGNGVSKIRILSTEHAISEGFPADGQWDTSDQLSTISEVTQPFHFQLNHMRADSGDWNSYRSAPSGPYSVGGNDDDDDYEGDSNSAPVKKVSVPPATPSTISSSTVEMERVYGSHHVPLKMTAPNRTLTTAGSSGNSVGPNSIVDDLTNDDMSLSDEASISSAHQKLMASNSISIRRINKSSRPPLYSTGTFTSTASSPEMRNKMRYFMGKYKHHPQQKQQQQRHDSEVSSGTATTAASSMTTELS
jgi:hypothetical protein